MIHKGLFESDHESFREVLARQRLVRRALEIGRYWLPGAEIEVLWSGMWVFRVGTDYFPNPDIRSVEEPEWRRLAGTAQQYIRDVGDYWYQFYKPKTGDVIVDVGAGRGEDAFVFSRSVGQSGHVWSIEPHPISFAVLTQFCALNRLSNVRTLNYACVEKLSQLRIESLPVWESNYVRNGDPSPGSHPVVGMSFDSICTELGIGQIDFLKMNIEGAERLALPGCRVALQRARNVCIASHDFRAERGEGEEFRTLDFVRAFLTQAGFELTTRDEDSRAAVRYHVHGRRSS